MGYQMNDSKPVLIQTNYNDIESINSFSGEYRFLSNFYPAVVVFENIVYDTSEHAYQASKTLDLTERYEIMYASSPSEAKEIGQRVTKRPMWEDLKVGFMYQIVKDKFSRNPELAVKLIETGDTFLEEGNTWGDTFWGVCKGEGQNYLGRVLMAVRHELTI